MANISLTESEFITLTMWTDAQVSDVLSKMSWNRMLELRSEYARALDKYSQKHKGSVNGMDATQIEALGMVGRIDRMLRTKYYNDMKNHPRFHGMTKHKAKEAILLEFRDLTKRKF